MKIETFWKKRKELSEEIGDLLDEINEDRDYLNKFTFNEVFNILLLDKLDKIERKLK